MISFKNRAEEATKRLPQLKKLMASCRLCPRECEKRRYRGETGDCGLGSDLIVSSSHLHMGEEPVISGRHGSGTVFFTGCNLACLFCQNFPISQLHSGRVESREELAVRFLELQSLGAHNINLVTPTPQLTRIMEALVIAWERGLSLPIVYNCGGYESVEVLRLMDGLIDIYMPDMKYGRDELSKSSGVEDYFSKSSKALIEMQRQVGDLVVDENGIAIRGLIVRHLVLPNDLSGTSEVLRFLAEKIGTGVYISLMSQYYPSHKAMNIMGLDTRLQRNEYKKAVDLVHELGLINGWIQPAPF